MPEKLIELEGGDANILIQWGEGRTAITMSETPLALDADGLDRLITALFGARSQMAKQERATLYARVPHRLKSELMEKAHRRHISQNRALIEAVEMYLGDYPVIR